MSISPEDLAKLARLAYLNVEPERAEKLRRDLNSIFDYMRQLEKVNVSTIEPMSHVHGASNVFRADEVKPSMAAEDALRNAPDVNGRYLRVPIIIE
jgi:aspartyl-tRNA(Asn)/glutamyl-tRNA(Gln) amidotransferase subunit C